MAATWFITGASSGIGRAVTEQLLARGDTVAATARSVAPLKDLADRFGDRLWTAPLDVTDTAALRETIDRVFAELGRVDVVFSNAGRAAFGAAEELADDAIADQIALNLTAPIQLLRAVLPRLRAQGGGRFIQTSSVGAQTSSPGGSLYHASKWGVAGFLESVIAEVTPFGIGITMVEPGMVRTPFGTAMSLAEAHPAYADTAVGQIRRVIESSGGNLTGAAPGDPERVAAAVIAAAVTEPAPRRVVLGAVAYESIETALGERARELEAGRAVAFSADFPR